ncbi:hypothetical protein E3V39_11470 [Gammaproteobacteria bacterium LSUCC0112]|nr:hypothetical protein E3V39_11470 [Gammaproteobacteria bacterium LSUCC0112]
MKLTFTITFIFLLMMGACSNRGAYEAFQANNRQQCFKLPMSQRDDCLDRASKPYNTYERERREASIQLQSHLRQPDEK